MNDLLYYLYERRKEDTVTELMTYCFDYYPRYALNFYKTIVKKAGLNEKKNYIEDVQFFSQLSFYIDKKLRIVPDIIGITYNKKGDPVSHIIIECKIDSDLVKKDNYKYLMNVKNSIFFLLCPNNKQEKYKEQEKKAKLNFEIHYINYEDFIQVYKNHSDMIVQNIVKFISDVKDDIDNEDYLKQARKYLKGKNSLANQGLFDQYLRKIIKNNKNDFDEIGRNKNIFYLTNRTKKHFISGKFFALMEKSDIGQSFGKWNDPKILATNKKIECPDDYEEDWKQLLYIDKDYVKNSKKMKKDEAKLYGARCLLKDFCIFLEQEGLTVDKGWECTKSGFVFFAGCEEKGGLEVSFRQNEPLLKLYVNEKLTDSDQFNAYMTILKLKEVNYDKDNGWVFYEPNKLDSLIDDYTIIRKMIKDITF